MINTELLLIFKRLVQAGDSKNYRCFKMGCSRRYKPNSTLANNANNKYGLHANWKCYFKTKLPPNVTSNSGTAIIYI